MCPCGPGKVNRHGKRTRDAVGCPGSLPDSVCEAWSTSLRRRRAVALGHPRVAATGPREALHASSAMGVFRLFVP